MDPPRPGDLKIAGLADRTSSLVGWTIAWRATSAVATLALGAVLVRQLPTSEYGRYTLALSVLVYIELLATFGQDQGLLRYLPEIVGRGDVGAGRAVLASRRPPRKCASGRRDRTVDAGGVLSLGLAAPDPSG